ncbi:MAG: hypothetical protein V4819_20740 [Verrucomicrobiota bacterium]
MSTAASVRFHFLAIILLPAAFVAVLSLWVWRTNHRSDGVATARAAVEIPRQDRDSASMTPQVVPAAANQVPLRPLPVSLSSATHEWTKGDAMDPKVIEKLAHNPDEFVRLNEENERIKRRQLVYRKETAAAVVQRAKLTGEPVTHLKLPALDGRELDVEITRADLSPSGQSGSFIGHIAGKPASMVTLAFKFGREAFTVSSPEDDFHLQADAHEPGQVIVKSIDPDVYASGTCGNK